LLLVKIDGWEKEPRSAKQCGVMPACFYIGIYTSSAY
jgi:hypothetical protein